MKYCDKCHVEIYDESTLCPLCQSILTDRGGHCENVFPRVPPASKRTNLLIRILLFASVVCCVVCIGINMILPASVFWAGFVVFGIVCLWISLAFAIKKIVNIPKSILYQVIVLGIFAFLWDEVTGSHGWSLNYVIPFLCVGAIIALAVLAWLMRLQLEDLIFYFLMYILFGIVPLTFLLMGQLTVLYPSLICVGLCLISLSALALFQGKNMVGELRRRFHL